MQRDDYLERARTGRLLSEAYGLAHDSPRITPAPQQAVKLCACGKPAVMRVDGVLMCAVHALAAQEESR
jgi:hypothetical protein